MADENPYRSPEAESSAAEKMTADPDKLRGMGCLALWIAFPVIHACAFLLSYGPYRTVMLILGCVGFTCGAALGAYVSVRTLHQPWWSSGRWAIYGIVGMCLLIFTSFAALVGWPR